VKPGYFSIQFTISPASIPYIRKVKQLLLLCVIVFQTLCGLCAGAKSVVSPDIKSQENRVAFSIPDEEPSSLKRTLKISRSLLKIRVSRSFASVSDLSGQPEAFYNLQVEVCKGYASPFYLPLVRLLLFPKHYFW
jgi:hypothetical protein